MKRLIPILAVFLFACSNNSRQKKIYEDSAIYFSNKLAEVTDSGYTQDDSVNIMRRGRATIYKIMRKHYIDKMNELK